MNFRELEEKIVAYTANYSGIGVIEIEHGIDDKVTFISGLIALRRPWGPEPRELHTLKLYYTSKGAYFKYLGYRIYMHELLRVTYPCAF